MPAGAAWNGKFMAVGNGGWSGAIQDAALNEAVNRGYAAAATDTGHSGGSANFALGHPEKVIDFAHKHRIIVVQDAAHIMLSYDDKPMSFLSVDGAKEVGVEVHSMSKGFHMIGWRLGWVCGHERIVRAFADVKDNCDSGQFMAIQKAAAAALDDICLQLAHLVVRDGEGVALDGLIVLAD